NSQILGTRYSTPERTDRAYFAKIRNGVACPRYSQNAVQKLSPRIIPRAGWSMLPGRTSHFSRETHPRTGSLLNGQQSQFEAEGGSVRKSLPHGHPSM